MPMKILQPVLFKYYCYFLAFGDYYFLTNFETFFLQILFPVLQLQALHQKNLIKEWKTWKVDKFISFQKEV